VEVQKSKNIFIFEWNSREYRLVRVAMSGKTLFATDFPVYTITASFDGHVVVTGGGGSAKTGVPNVLVS